MESSVVDYIYYVRLKHRFKKKYCSKFNAFGFVGQVSKNEDDAKVLELTSNGLFRMQDDFMFSLWKVEVLGSELIK